MPGQAQPTVDQLASELKEFRALRVTTVLLFGIPDCKDAAGISAWDADGPVPSAIRVISQLVADRATATSPRWRSPPLSTRGRWLRWLSSVRWATSDLSDRSLGF